MEFDIPNLPVRDRHKLLSAVVLPRPIAWVTTLSPEGVLNAAPFSFFNLMGSDPAIVVLGVGISDRGPGVLKDTGSNIQLTREFVIQLVTEPLAGQMNQTAIDFPPDMDEVALAGLTTVPGVRVRVPRIAESPVHMECRHVSTVEIGKTRIIIGEVVHLHIDDAYYDAATGHVKTEQFQAIGRMHGSGWYARTTDLFDLPRVSFKRWQQK